MSCDEYVLQNSTRDIREYYSRSLLGFATNQRNIGAGMIAFGESDTRKRVKHIMKFKECGKWIGMIAVGLIIATGVVCLTDAKETGIDTTVIASQKGINDFLESYFTDLLNTIKADSEKDYTSQDFSSVKGYIVDKQLVNTRHIYKKLSGGIQSVTLDELILEDLSSTGDKMEAMVHVKYSFICPEDEEECSVGQLYQVSLSKTEDGYCVLDLDNDDIEIIMAKEEILGNSDLRNEVVSESNSVSAYNLSDTDSELDYLVADAYFAKLEENTDSLLQNDVSRGE